jgi:hypothetical protein
MTGQNYLEFLQNELPELEDVPLVIPDMWCNISVTLPNRWISRGSAINWPPRSPDLTPLDFCLWGWMKSEVYKRVDTWDELLDHIMDTIARIKERQDELRQATCHVLTWVAKCIDVDGGIFGNPL